MLMSEEEKEQMKQKTEILLEKQKNLTAEAFKYQVMAIDKEERIASKAACFYSPTLQYLNNAPSKRKYLKMTKSKEKLTPKEPTSMRAKTPIKKRSPISIPKHHVSKSLALKIDNRKVRKKHSSMQIETEFTPPPPRYPGFPDSEAAIH